MLQRIKDLMAKRDEGFTLIELLVVVIIIGILAAIAIPIFLNQRNGARDASVKADMDGMAKLMETYYTNTGKYPISTDGNWDADFANQVRVSPGNYVTVGYFDNEHASSDDTTAVSYQICGFNVDSQRAFVYDSAAGGLSTLNVVQDPAVAPDPGAAAACVTGGIAGAWQLDGAALDFADADVDDVFVDNTTGGLVVG